MYGLQWKFNGDILVYVLVDLMNERFVLYIEINNQGVCAVQGTGPHLLAAWNELVENLA